MGWEGGQQAKKRGAYQGMKEFMKVMGRLTL